MTAGIEALLIAFRDAAAKDGALPWGPVERDRGLRRLFGADRWLDPEAAVERAPVLGDNPLHDADSDLLHRTGVLLAWACEQRLCIRDSADGSWTLLEEDVVFCPRGPDGWLDLRAASGLERTLATMAGRERRERDRQLQRQSAFAARLIVVLAGRFEPSEELPGELVNDARPGVRTWGALADFHRSMPTMALWRRHATLRAVVDAVRRRNDPRDLAELAP